jgi:hypothetical protein
VNATFPLIFVAAASVFGAQDARQIVEESQKRGSVQSQRYEGRLRVEDKARTIAEKEWRYVRQGSYGRSKAVLRFTAPAEVKGVALLIVNHPERASDQWMWTPAIARERRIAFQDRSTRFFGTDFSFEDLEERDVDQFDYKLMGEETINGAKCWRIESKPRQTKSSQYTLSQIWIRQADYVPARVDSYLKDQVVRRLNYSDIEKVQGVWLARTLEMNDLRRGSRTYLKLEKLQLNVPVNDSDFTVQALRREQ